MKEKTLSKTQQLLYDYILEKYKADGKFNDTNRQLGRRFDRSAQTMQYNLKALEEKGLVDCKTVVEDSGYVYRYVTPKNITNNLGI